MASTNPDRIQSDSTTHDGVTIVGSANLDVVFTVERVPGPGETLLAESAARYPGGKGLNQAVAAARAGAATCFVGAVGNDDAGQVLRSTMSDAAIDTEFLRTDDAETGQAFIVVDRSGENTIIVASGANASVVELTGDERAQLERSAVVLMQLELPLAAVSEAARVAHYAGTTVMVNAAPAMVLSAELLAEIDVLIVNEHEATIVGAIDDVPAASAALAALVPRLIVTLGAKGSVLYESGIEKARIASPKVVAVDTTGAGDTFCGAFAAGIAAGRTFEAAATFASMAAALSVQRLGAVPSIPRLAEIEGAFA
jgi:ribokinase